MMMMVSMELFLNIKEKRRSTCESRYLGIWRFSCQPGNADTILGPKWDLAHARGSRFNTGEGIQMALNIGAIASGNWSGCHSVGGDRYLPEFTEGFQKLVIHLELW